MDRKGLIKTVESGRFEWRKHTIERLAERGILQEEVLRVLKEGEQIEDYPEDTPYPSALFFTIVSGRPLHVVAAFDAKNDWVYIITAYVPDSEHFKEDYKTRKNI
jgi:hypothetical protein